VSNLKSYLITDPQYYGSTPSHLLKTLSLHVKDKAIDYICFRDKSTQDIEPLIQTFVAFAKANNILHVMINSHIDLAYKYGAYGVHLTSMQFGEIKRAKELGLFVVISTHSLQEIEKVEKLGADVVTFSPIFKTPNKGEPKGIEALHAISSNTKMKVIALGGIVTPLHVKEIEEANVYGFASIRYFLV